VGSLTTSTFEKSFLASACSLGTQDIQDNSYLCQNVIIKMQATPRKYLVKCTLENGGGQCRYIHTNTLHTSSHTHIVVFSDPWSYADQAQQ